MKTQTLGWLVGLSALACSFTSCAEPATECQVGLAGFNSYVVVFTPVGSPTPAGCDPGVGPTGDIVGMEFFHPASMDLSTYDDTQATVAIQTDTLGQQFAKYTYFGCSPATCGAGCTSDFECNGDDSV